METFIIIGVIAVICVIAVISYAKKLSRGCCGAAGDKEKRTAAKQELSEYTHRYSIKIGGMTCQNCAIRIENNLNKNEGIYARVEHKSGIADLYSMQPVKEFTIRQTVVGLGYSVESIEQIK